MSWDSVPWFVGGGAEHSPEVARLMAYAATAGAEGIVGTGDLRVAPLSVPGGSVRVAPGAALIRNRATGGASQTYVARNPTEDVVAIAATGSGGGRTDLIVAQVEDPFMAGEPWQTPTNPAVGPYIFTRVIPNVPAGTTSLRNLSGYSGRSAVVLARVNIPASTGTITAGMITDLRNVALPRATRSLDIFGASGGALGSTTEAAWPTNERTVEIPEWATRLKGSVTLTGVMQTGGNEASIHRLKIGSSLISDVANVGIEADSTQRVTLTLPFTVPIAAALRGTTQSVTLLSRRSNSTNPGRFTAWSAQGAVATFDFYFEESPA